MSPEETQKFEEIARPLMQYLAEDHHPHTVIILSSTTAQLMEGITGFQTEDYIQD